MRTETAELIHAGLSDYKNMGNGKGWLEKDGGNKEFSCNLGGKKTLILRVNPELSKKRNFSKNSLYYTDGELSIHFHMCVRKTTLKPLFLSIEYEAPNADVDRDGKFYKTSGNLAFMINGGNDQIMGIEDETQEDIAVLTEKLKKMGITVSEPKIIIK